MKRVDFVPEARVPGWICATPVLAFTLTAPLDAQERYTLDDVLVSFGLLGGTARFPRHA